MTSPDERVLDKVRKLLAKAEHPSTPPAEAEAMSEKAAELMARHAIDEALLEEERPDRSVPERRIVRVVAPYAVPKAVLLSRVAAAYRVRAVIAHDTTGGRLCSLVGFPADLAVVELLFTSLLLQATTAMLAATAGHHRIRAFRHAFLLGYAATIGRRLDDANARSVEATATKQTSASLVLASREAEVDNAFAEMFPRLGSLRTTMSNGEGMAAGVHAGARASLDTGRRRVSDARRSLGA